MKLCQGQVWKQGHEFIRIVRLERLEVEYKSMPDLVSKQGTLQITSKKDFCRLLKGAKLLKPKAGGPSGEISHQSGACQKLIPQISKSALSRVS